MRSKGCGIVYISHRLEELQHIVDRVTIMRDGQYITAMNFKDATMDEIIAHMVGREIKEKFPHVECKKEENLRGEELKCWAYGTRYQFLLV